MDKSHLGRLPSELRLTIYEYALHQDKGVSLIYHERQDRILLNNHPSKGLTQTCRQLHHETLPVLLKSPTFNLHCRPSDPHQEDRSAALAVTRAKRASERIRATFPLSTNTLTRHLTKVHLSIDIFSTFLASFDPHNIMLMLTHFSAAFPDRDSVALTCHISVPCVESVPGGTDKSPVVFTTTRGETGRFRKELGGFVWRCAARLFEIESGEEEGEGEAARGVMDPVSRRERWAKIMRCRAKLDELGDLMEASPSWEVVAGVKEEDEDEGEGAVVPHRCAT